MDCLPFEIAGRTQGKKGENQALREADYWQYIEEGRRSFVQRRINRFRVRGWTEADGLVRYQLITEPVPLYCRQCDAIFLWDQPYRPDLKFNRHTQPGRLCPTCARTKHGRGLQEWHAARVPVEDSPPSNASISAMSEPGEPAIARSPSGIGCRNRRSTTTPTT